MSFLNKLFGIFEEKLDEEKIHLETSTKNTSADEQAECDTSADLHNIAPEQIYLQQEFDDKSKVLKFISEKMQSLGFINGNYFDALTKREALISTYLINGIAIPHGINEARSLIKETGVVIVQIPAGVIWNESGDVVKLAVGIAAKNNEHLPLLQKLSTIVMDPVLSKRLVSTTKQTQIIQTLNTKKMQVKTLPEGFTVTAEAIVVEELGLHAEPAAILAEHAATYTDTQIHLHFGGRCANIKSMPVILMMGVKKGDSIIISAKGTHAQVAVDELAELVNAGLTSG